MSISKERREKVERVLGEPFLDEFSENTYRIRRNLIAAGGIAIFYKTFELNISEESSFLGIKLDGLTYDKTDLIALVVISYLLCHFLVSTVTHFGYWRLRLSGMRVRYLTAAEFAGDVEDSPSDPLQSTLFWHLKRKTFAFKELEKKFGEIDTKLDDILKDGRECDQYNEVLTQVSKKLKSISETFEGLDRTIVSLSRFDACFSNFQFIQISRWILVEWAFPLVVGGYALLLLC